MVSKRLFATLITLAVLACWSHATIINVPDDCSTIQAGIDSSAAGDTVLVQPGVYLENIDYNAHQTVVASLYLTTNDTSYISQTVIDGNQAGSVITFDNGEDSTAVLIGFTLTNGLAQRGGGINLYTSSPRLIQLVIKENRATSGGGGIFYESSSPYLENVSVLDNVSEAYGGGMDIYMNSNAVMLNVIVSGNSAAIIGGGINGSFSSNITISNALITGNSAGDGGGIQCEQSGIISLYNTTISENTATGSGGGLMINTSGTISLVNTIFWSEEGQEIQLVSGILAATYSDVQGGWSGIGNINSNPLFIDPQAGDFHLSNFSPCMGIGTLAGAPPYDLEGNPRPSPVGSNPDLGAYESALSAPVQEPNISVSEDSLDFGLLNVGVIDTLSLQVTNSGNMDLIIINAVVSTPEYTVFPTYAGLNPGEQEIFSVRFAPTDTLDYPATLLLVSNDPDQDTTTIVLLGAGANPAGIAVSPDTLYQSLEVGDSGSQMLTVTNTGGNHLTYALRPGSYEGNYALAFDGVNDYVSIPAEALDSLTSGTLEAWIHLTADNEETIISKQHDGSGTYGVLSVGYFCGVYGSAVSGEPGRVYFHCRNDVEVITSQALLDTGRSYHIAVAFSDSSATLFIDGEQDTTVAGNFSIPGEEDATATSIGAWMGSGGGRYFSGSIDEVRIWNLARTQEEIQATMYCNITGEEDSLLACWRLNEGAGIIAFDATSNGLHGYLQNNPTWSASEAGIAPDWMTAEFITRICSPGTFDDIPINFNAADMDTGVYQASLVVLSDAPVTPEVTIPVYLQVTPYLAVENPGDKAFPGTFSLEQNYPNPFNPLTNITFSLPQASHVTLRIYNIQGQTVAILVDGPREAAKHDVVFDATGLASGMYIYRLEADNFSAVRKMMLVK